MGNRATIRTRKLLSGLDIHGKDVLIRPDSYHTLVAGLLARSQYLEGPATGHLDTGFPWCPCVYKQMLRWFPRLKLLLHASRVAVPT